MAGENRRILVLDDEPDILEAYQTILSPKRASKMASSRSASANNEAPQQGPTYEITAVNTGEKALERIAYAIREGEPFAAAFCDVRLGAGIDGIETIKRAKVMDTNMLFVIVTAYQDRKIDDIQSVLGDDFSGRWDFLDKPFANMVIEQKAHNLIAKWNTAQRERAYLAELKKLYEEEEVFRNVLADTFFRLNRHCSDAMKKKPTTDFANIFKSIEDETKGAQEALESFRESFKKAA